ncbi:NADH dehydrogenase [ubiquinone] 1 beta subcomplex subunit 8, mitochondrial isoform X1 [Polistes fuscatus]|uniref:NADH dehydrogenase [ubiquinone] 1 beta subcomplex subunit 8, mitochondrial isoform X1 n=1 Tax=Polistes fuscatus TaxID=30207 RepID=UPI001CA99E10|nr:NADH dehydrogenase [ubiquinone] 1 beta subcomplex subunit 8, mitochondrial isoform X1 [Polistes fuscatus]
MALLKNCMTLRGLIVSRNKFTLFMKANYSEETRTDFSLWRAKKEVPKTEEEIKEAAKKYNLHPRETKAYEEDGFGYGDYPKLPFVSPETKDPYYPYDFPEFRRNLHEPVHIEADIIGEDRYSAGVRQPMSPVGASLMFFGTVTILGGLFYLFSFYPWFQPVMEKQYPKPGVTHYTFEPVKTS